jgi:hypothetical protein
MSRHRLTVVLSQAPGKHPAKRSLEEAVAASLIMEPGLDVSIVPNLYDLGPDHTGRLFLGSVKGDMVVLSWLYPRAAFWLLDRDGIKGHWGETQLKPPADDDEEDESGEPAPPKGIGAAGDLPDRHIYCLDLRDLNSHQPYVEEVRRIAAECRERADRAVGIIRRRGYRVVGDVERLRVPAELPPRPHPETVSNAALVDSATTLIAEMLADVRRIGREKPPDMTQGV